ncbi:DUF4352 domain-containing protein [Streptomyces sp. NPDC001984]
MRTRTAITAVLLLGATTTACSSSGGEPETIRVTVTQTATTTPGAADDAKADDGPLKIRATATVRDSDGTTVKATVLAYTQPEKGPAPPDKELGGDAWATAEVKVCNVQGDISVSQFPWSLSYPDDTRIEVTGLNGGDLPKPEFPTDDVAVKPGDCLRGKIPFPVPSSKRPDRIVYAPDGSEPVEWAVPKA